MICQGAEHQHGYCPVCHCAQHGHFAVLPAARAPRMRCSQHRPSSWRARRRAGRKLDGGAATRGRKRRGTDDARTNREGHCARCPRGGSFTDAVTASPQDLVGAGDSSEHRRRSAHDGESTHRLPSSRSVDPPPDRMRLRAYEFGVRVKQTAKRVDVEDGSIARARRCSRSQAKNATEPARVRSAAGYDDSELLRPSSRRHHADAKTPSLGTRVGSRSRSTSPPGVAVVHASKSPHRLVARHRPDAATCSGSGNDVSQGLAQEQVVVHRASVPPDVNAPPYLAALPRRPESHDASCVPYGSCFRRRIPRSKYVVRRHDRRKKLAPDRRFVPP